MIPVPVGAILLSLSLLAAAPANRTAVTVQTGASPTEAPPAVAAPVWAHCPDWWPVAHDAGWPDDELPTLDRVMWCESRCQADARNRSGAAGLMQVMPMHWHGRDPYDPATNLTIALEVHDRQGWKAWSCF